MFLDRKVYPFGSLDFYCARVWTNGHMGSEET